ncbi:MAG TPA: DUF3703 domain-containing protein [Flavobacteriales bacterium]|nr:DUF3703 domain-containing protein [Flavobacteriales bacterium]
MRLHWRMPQFVGRHYRAELAASLSARANGELQREWHHLERAHILAQRWPLEHNAVHWRMLRFGFRVKDLREILGQLPRLVFGGVKSFVGQVPIGNTGGANVPALRSMPLPDDLAIILSPTNA